jgi:hypothetical protein
MPDITIPNAENYSAQGLADHLASEIAQKRDPDRWGNQYIRAVKENGGTTLYVSDPGKRSASDLKAAFGFPESLVKRGEKEEAGAAFIKGLVYQQWRDGDEKMPSMLNLLERVKYSHRNLLCVGSEKIDHLGDHLRVNRFIESFNGGPVARSVLPEMRVVREIPTAEVKPYAVVDIRPALDVMPNAQAGQVRPSISDYGSLGELGEIVTSGYAEVGPGEEGATREPEGTETVASSLIQRSESEQQS